ncbi:histidinolphosphatase [Puccinia graminis f. sp. tritici]|uniref:histidinol-phosphatase n=1 Tax=Puccinia graminis f. sp. tritici TaxID=56615 RepID=A0A5B0QH53_PUCGR|nr:histidinolphosphatase [Puccinia graminis f. sp. tritici]
MPISLHSHSGQFCKHATGTLDSVIRTAIDRGFISYGLSEHMPRDRVQDLYPEESGIQPSELGEQFDCFIAEAGRLKQLYSPQIGLLVGIETELIEQSNTFQLLDQTLTRHRDTLDYLVGSVHHVNQIPIDFDRPMFDRALLSFESTNHSLEPLHRLCEAYFDAQHTLIERYRPEVIGHFDLCLLFNPDLDLQAEPAVWTKIERNVRLAISYGALFEVNSASIRKGWPTPYPSPPILQLIISLGGRLTLSDDSHGSDRVGLNYDKSFDYLKMNNVSTLWYLVPAAEEHSIMQPRGKVSAVPIPGNWWEHPFWSQASANPVTAANDRLEDLDNQPTSSSSASIELASLNFQSGQTPNKSANDERFKWSQFPIDKFTNQTWFIVSSSLPFWKSKKNATISYSNLDNEPSSVMYDLVEYHGALTDEPSSKRRKIEGIDRPKSEMNEDAQLVEWRWRGKGLLRLLSSDWQVIGYNLSSSKNGDENGKPSGPDWVVTFFRQTLVTPAGIDIYSRSPTSLPTELKEQLLQALRNHPSKLVSSLVDSMFDIPHDIP